MKKIVTAALLALGALGSAQAKADWWDYLPINWCLLQIPWPTSGAGASPSNPHPSCSKCERTCTSSPCYVRSGAYTTGATDLTLAGVLPVSFSRSYLSTSGNGPVGRGFSMNVGARIYYGTFLLAAPSTTRSEAYVTFDGGHRFKFVQNVDGSFTPPPGRQDVLARNGDGTFTLTLSGGGTIYQFRTDGALTSISDEYGNLVSFAYDGSARLQTVSDNSGSGRSVTVSWGADGRISGLQDNAGRQVTYTYAGDGTLTTVTDPAGRDTNYTYVAGRSGKLLSGISDNWDRPLTTITYDGSDRVVSYTQEGETYTYARDVGGDPNKATKADSNGNVLQLTYDAEGRITSRKEPGATNATALVYASDGTLQLETDPQGVKTSYTYDSKARILTRTDDYQGADPVRWEYTYDATYPDKVATIVPKNPANNQVHTGWQGSKFEYHGAGSAAPGTLWKTYRLQSDGTTADLLSTMTYDTKGRVTSQNSPGGGTTDTAYDSNGNVQSVTGAANNDANQRPVTTFAYDTAGRVTSVTDPAAKVTSYTYDSLGRPATATLPKPTAGSPLNFTTTYAYDQYDAASGLVFTHVTDPNGKLTKMGYDQFGRLKKTIDALGNATIYTYTKNRLASITDANGNVTAYTYDGQGRLTKTTFPDAAEETYTYRDDGLLATKTDRRSITTTFTYDARKRLTQKSYSGGGAISYTYEGQKLAQVVDTSTSPSETHTFAYDASFRVTSETQGPRGTITRTYEDERPATMVITGGPTTTYEYFPDGSLKEIDWSPVGTPFSYTYTTRGQYSQVTLANGVTRTYTYDDQGRLTALANALGGTTIASYAYGYDLDHATGQSTILGQRTSMTQTVPSQSLTGAESRYLYDGLYQLKEARYPTAAPFNGEVHAWTYDAIGNRLTNTVNATTATYGYYKNGSNPNNGQRLQSDGASTYTYDNAGNTIGRSGSPATTYGYDKENRTSSIGGTVTATYAYDYQGRRTGKTVGGTTTTYLYDGVDLIAENAGGQTTHFLNGPGVDEPLAVYGQGALTFLATDSLGSVTATTNAAGTVTHSSTMDAWGSERSTSGTRTHAFTYTGREIGEAGALFYRARCYQPGIGRFSQEDPIGTVSVQPTFFSGQGRQAIRGIDRNSYRYVWNRPLTMIDPTGEMGAAVAGALPIAGGCAAADGPFPIGDAIGLTILMAAAAYDATNADADTERCESCEDRERRCWGQYSDDLGRCSLWWGKRAKNSRNAKDYLRACNAQATVRYAECKRFGQPISLLSPHPFQY